MFRKGLLPFALICVFAFAGVPAGATTTTTTEPSAGECSPIDLNQGTASNAACADLPHFKASFTNRIWKFKGNVNEVDGYRHLLSFNLESMPNLPQRFAGQDDEILDQDMIARFRRSTRIYDPQGKRADPQDLYYASGVVVSGRLLKQSAWMKGEDGSLIPTIRARRITIVDYADSGDDAGEEASAPEPQPETQPEPQVEQPSNEYRKYPRWNKYPKYNHEHPEEEQEEEQPAPVPTPTPAPTPVNQTPAGTGPMVCEHISRSEVSEDGSISTWVEVKCRRK